MKISNIIEVLQAIYDDLGDLEAYSPIGEDAKLLIESDVTVEDSEYFVEQLEKGCRCMSCWEKVKIKTPFVLIE